MSKRNGNRSRNNVQRRHKAALRLRRLELITRKPAEKVVSISTKQSAVKAE